MEGRRRKKYLPEKWILFCMALLIIFLTIGQNKIICSADAVGTMDAEVRDINLNWQGNFAGLYDPGQPSAADADWMGVYLYFGEYQQGWFGGKTPVKWRVLDANTTEYGKEGEPTVLLLSDKVVAKAEFHLNQEQTKDGGDAGEKKLHPANEYAYSNIRKWLNSESEAYGESEYFKEGFYTGAFLPGEQNAIAVSVKKAGGQILGYGDNSGLSQKGTCDKVFLLGADEALNPLYGFFPNLHVDMAKSDMLEVASYAGKHGVAEEKGIGAWWLRSTNPNSSSIVYYVNSRGRIGAVKIGSSSRIGVAPAVNLKLSAIAFICQDGKRKDVAFEMTSAAEKNKEWELALWGGNGFAASWAGEDGRNAIVCIDAVGTPDEGMEYTQISAMLVDGKGTVFCYGKVGKTVKTGEVEIAIPEKIPAGTYGLKVFAEDVNGEGYTDFVSNMEEFTVQVLDAGTVQGMPAITPAVTATPLPTPTLAATATPAGTFTPTLAVTTTPVEMPTPILAVTATPAVATSTIIPTPTLTATSTFIPTPANQKTITPTPPQAAESTAEKNNHSGKALVITLIFLLAIAIGCAGGIIGIHWSDRKNTQQINTQQINKQQINNIKEKSKNSGEEENKSS